MSTYRVPKCGRHFVKFDDVTIYPVLVVARTELRQHVAQSRLEFYLLQQILVYSLVNLLLVLPLKLQLVSLNLTLLIGFRETQEHGKI